MTQLVFSNTILFLVILFLLFKEEISARIFKKAAPPLPPVSSTMTDSIKKYEQSNSNIPPYLLHFITGQRNALGLTRLALFEMYRDNELLDYDALINGIMDRIKKYDNQTVVDSVMSELTLYMKNKEPHTGSPNGPLLPGSDIGGAI